MITVMSFSFFISVKNYSDDLAALEFHTVFLASHLNYHERDSNHKDLDVDDEESVSHSHTHKHSEDGEEHTHKHINVITFSDIIFFQITSLYTSLFDIHNSRPTSNGQLFSGSFILEILRPPIYS